MCNPRSQEADTDASRRRRRARRDGAIIVEDGDLNDPDVEAALAEAGDSRRRRQEEEEEDDAGGILGVEDYDELSAEEQEIVDAAVDAEGEVCTCIAWASRWVLFLLTCPQDHTSFYIPSS